MGQILQCLGGSRRIQKGRQWAFREELHEDKSEVILIACVSTPLRAKLGIIII